MALRGKKFTEEHRRKLSLSHRGPRPWAKGLHGKTNDALKKWKENGGIPWNKGKHWNEKLRRKMSQARLGRYTQENHPNWKGGTTPLYKKIRTSLEYKLWREAVFNRDNYTCIWCGQKGGELNADHIKRFSEYPELRFAIDNGRTLCKPCHKTTENYGNKKIQTRSII